MLEEILKGDVLKNINANLEELFLLIPELKSMVGFEHKHPHHHLDVWNHTLYALSLSEDDFMIRLTLLLHDIGKPFCFTEGDVRHFNGHPLVSALIAKDILERLGYEEAFINDIVYLVKNYELPIRKTEIEKNRELEIKRYEVQRCDALAHHPDKLEKRIQYLDKVKVLIKQ